MSAPLPDLPGPLAEPLHLLEPTWSLWPSLLVGLAASALFAWLRHRYRQWRRERRLGEADEPPPAAAPAALAGGGEVSEIERRIRELRLQNRSPEAMRAGCHELSTLLRGHLADSLAGRLVPFDPDCLTGREIGWLFGGAVRRFFLLLTQLQFGRREPQSGEFDKVCEMAVEVVRSEPRPKRRWARREEGGLEGGDDESDEMDEMAGAAT